MEEIDVWDEVIRWGIAQHPNLIDTGVGQWTNAQFLQLEKTVKECIPHNEKLTDHFETNKTSPPASPASPGNKLVVTSPSALTSTLIDSTIINRKHSALISHWIDSKEGEPDPYRYCYHDFKLLYRGTRDGFDVREFHARCDRHGPTVVVIKVADTDDIIGGYNPCSWSASGYYKNSTRSFIFSLGAGLNTKDAILSRVIVRQSSFAICDYGVGNLEDSVGFGAGDLPLFGFKSKRASHQRQVISSQSFNISEFEVFQVTRRIGSSS